MATGIGNEQTNRAVGAAIDNLTRQVNTSAAALKGLSAAASPNGMKALDSGFQVLASTIGSGLLPVFAMLNAGVMTVADLLWSDLKPGLSGTVTGFVKFSEQVISATQAAYEFAKVLGNSAKFLTDPKSWNLSGGLTEWGKAHQEGLGLDEKLNEANRRNQVKYGGGSAEPWERERLDKNRPMTPDQMHAQDDEASLRAGFLEGMQDGAPSGGGAGGGANGIRQMFMQNMKDIITDQKMSMGGGASFGGIGDAWKKMQVSTSQSNVTAKIYDRFGEAIKLLEQVVRGIDNQPQAVGP